MLILGLLGMYFDAAVVFVAKSSLLFRLAVAILCAPGRGGRVGYAHPLTNFQTFLRPCYATQCSALCAIIGWKTCQDQ